MPAYRIEWSDEAQIDVRSFRSRAGYANLRQRTSLRAQRFRRCGNAPLRPGRSFAPPRQRLSCVVHFGEQNDAHIWRSTSQRSVPTMRPLRITNVYFGASGVIPPAVLAASLAAFIFLVSSAFWTQPSAVSMSFLYWSGLSSRSARSRISRFMYAMASS